MVHALQECWRVLGHGGRLVDLRPVHSNPHISVITSDGRIAVGYLNDEAERVNDIAADNAVDEMVQRGQFTPLLKDNFDFASYWETLEGMLAYADRKWRDKKKLAPGVVDRARSHIAVAAGQYRLCVCSKIQIGIYSKQE